MLLADRTQGRCPEPVVGPPGHDRWKRRSAVSAAPADRARSNGSSRVSAQLREGLREICDQIVHVFQPDRQAEEIVGRPAPL